MMTLSNEYEAFLAFTRAGLWETDALLSEYGKTGYAAIMRMAEEQSMVGIIAAGLEHVHDVIIPKEEALAFVGSALQLEQRNKAMNNFVANLIEKLRYANIYTLLVKGQGIAQCYARPLWRACGDVDLFLSKENYKKAKSFLVPLASHVDEEDKKRQHLALTIEGWVVELHGTLHCGISCKIDKGLDKIKADIFEGGQVRSWMNGRTQVFLPSADNDVIIIFTHILQHFFDGGIGLRQVCDWCRLLWTYRSKINLKQLEERLREMGLMTEWKAFAALAVEWLGMPIEAMPLYSASSKLKRKSERILALILDTGNFGQGRDWGYKNEHSFFYKTFYFILAPYKRCL